MADETLVAKTPDRMTAQVLYQNVGGRYKDAVAIKVVEFNDDSISSMLGNDKLSEIVAERNNASQQVQNALFIESNN